MPWTVRWCRIRGFSSQCQSRGIEARGFKAISRWLSAATLPDRCLAKTSTPRPGVPANHRPNSQKRLQDKRERGISRLFIPCLCLSLAGIPPVIPTHHPRYPTPHQSPRPQSPVPTASRPMAEPPRYQTYPTAHKPAVPEVKSLTTAQPRWACISP